ncbi:hypothetical protein LAZ67_1002622 [Cordylochernes scorpioides]|uniref:ATP-dependent DNA helicase n=1 Tax=Cordylochernes scorpioides TaxID=51811 RepID=A0ABY6JWI8_9ARAC|nr:hypothetical protein LAZ67_1002622 [Cordylochernes scorpioides]
MTTRMNRLHPKESEDSENGKEHFQNRFKSQENVYARKYNGKGKWEPGKIKTVLGPRNYEVIMENGVTAKRHKDQLMRRVKEEVSEDVEKKEECNTERRGEQMNDPNESQERLEETPGPSRPIRNRRLPEYLKDCVTNWGDTTLMNNIIEATILNGKYQGEHALLPRIPMIPMDTPFEFKRLQFPVRLAFATTINKAQGQSLQVCGLNLINPCFSHGQLVECDIERDDAQ